MLTTREAAQRLTLTREQLLRKIERGLIAARFDGRRWLVDPKSVQEYAERHEAATAAGDRGTPQGGG